MCHYDGTSSRSVSRKTTEPLEFDGHRFAITIGPENSMSRPEMFNKHTIFCNNCFLFWGFVEQEFNQLMSSLPEERSGPPTPKSDTSDSDRKSTSEVKEKKSESESQDNVWTTRKPNFHRTVRALFKKNILIKVRKPSAMIEFFVGVIVWLVILPIWILGRKEFDGQLDPPLEFTPIIPVQLLLFFAYTEQPTLVGLPNHENVHWLFDTLFSVMDELPSNLTQNVRQENVTIKYTDNLDEMQTTIYATESNALGIFWVNAADEDAFTSPMFQVFVQSFGVTPTSDLFDMLYHTVALNRTNLKLALMNVSMQTFATPPTTELFDISLAIAMFMVLPIFFTTMPDFQTILEEKDSRVQTLSFLMGCPETAYFMVSIITQVVLSFIAYLVMCLALTFGFCLKGVDFSLFLVVSFLFVVSHIFFQMFLTTFMRKMSTGRATTVVLLVLTVFFAYLHMFFTLDATNTSEALKHVFSILPISAYQMVVMSIYKNSWQSLPPVTWTNMNPGLEYPVWWGLIWLSVDAILFLLLFCLFNLTNSRDFGTPTIKWSEICKKEAWQRAFSDSIIAKRVAPENVPLVEVKGLCKTYHGNRKDIVALTDVNFAISAGEVIVVIGPNGAGKSTMMNILSGALEPSSGTISIMGSSPTTRFKEIQKYEGVCFQENVLVNLLTVKEHFYLFGAFRGVKNEDIQDFLDFFADNLQLREMLDNRAGDLSGGQKRKLCIALSLLGNPPFVIMDEPTAGVDVQSRQTIWKAISALKDTTVVVTSHALEEAEAVSSRLFVVAGGELPFSGTSTELREEFKCGYLLRIDTQAEDITNVLDFVKNYAPEARILEDRPDTIGMKVSKEIPKCLKALEENSESLGVRSFTFAVEQLEDVLLKLIMSSEAAFEEVEHE